MISNRLSNEVSGWNLILVVTHAKKQRFSVEAKPCLKFWFNNGKLVAGCTTAIDPDG